MQAPLPVTARPRVWPVFVAYCSFFVLYLGSALGVVVIAMVARMLPGGRRAPEPSLEELVMSFGVLGGSFVCSLSLLTAFALIGARLSPGPWRQRLRWLPWAGGLPVIGLVMLAGLGQSTLEGVVVAMVGPDPNWIGVKLSQSLSALPAAQYAAMMVLVGVVGPVAEELFFRGFIQTRLSDRWGRWPAILVTALLFGLYHLDPTHIVVAGLLGVLIGWVAEVTGSIVPCVAMHIANNLVATALARLATRPTHGVSGEGIATAAVAGAVAVACVALTRRRVNGFVLARAPCQRDGSR